MGAQLWQKGDTSILTPGERLRVVMDLLGRGRGDQVWLADQIHVTARTITRWVKGQLPFPSKRRRQVEDVLRLDKGWLDLEFADTNALNVALRASGKLRRVVDTPHVQNAPMDPAGIPKHLRSPTESREAVSMVAERAGAALARALEENEVGGTKDGRSWLVGQLLRLQNEFYEEGHNPGAFADAINYIVGIDRPQSAVRK